MHRIYWMVGNLLFPQRCPWCGRVIGFSGPCERCVDVLPHLTEEESALLSRQAGCRAINSLAACCRYEGVAKRAMQRLKFQGMRSLAPLVANEMAQCAKEQFPDVRFDVIVPVPTSRKSLARRGYNVPALLAKTVGAILAIPVENDILVKECETRYQHDLPREGRAANLLGAFRVKRPEMVAGKRVLLIDDIVTTGATLAECAKMLELAGAKAVDTLCFAYTVKEKAGAAD